MIILGINDRAKTIDRGSFYCPHCQHTRPYEKKKAKLYFSLFFIPLIPLKDLGEFIECQHCFSQYDEDVSRGPRPAPAVGTRLPAVRQDLESGTPLEMVRQKLINQGYAPDFARELVETATGSPQRRCPACRLTYLSSVTYCAGCGAPLREARA